MNQGSYEHETCIKRQLIPYNFGAYQYLKIEVGTKVASFLKSAHSYYEHLSAVFGDTQVLLTMGYSSNHTSLL